MYKMTLMIIVKPWSKSKSMPLSQLTELNKSLPKSEKGRINGIKITWARWATTHSSNSEIMG